MKKLIYLIVAIAILIGGFYVFNNYIYQEKQGEELPRDFKEVTFQISGEPVTFINGVAEAETALGGASMTTIRYFGNEVMHDIDGDGEEDVVFLVTQETGGSGTFFYAVGALSRDGGYLGTHAVYIGDRIAPQTTNKGEGREVVVNYADRAPGEPFTEQPSIGKSLYLLLDTETLQFGEVVQDFEGEADPSSMTLDMKTWKWVTTTYNNDTELTPKKDEFTITFASDDTFSATTDCNSMRGTYTTNGDTLSFGDDIAMTRMFCQDSQEQEFASMLLAINSFFFTSRGELVMELKFDTGSAIFR